MNKIILVTIACLLFAFGSTIVYKTLQLHESLKELDIVLSELECSMGELGLLIDEVAGKHEQKDHDND